MTIYKITKEGASYYIRLKNRNSPTPSYNYTPLLVETKNDFKVATFREIE